MTEQQREIETIRERTIKIALSDADCERIAERAGSANMTVGELLGQFIGDLVCGTYSNGSDERDMARSWYDRCWFGAFPDRTFLAYLVGEYVLQDYEDTKAQIKYMQDDIEGFESQLEEVRAEEEWTSSFTIERVDGKEIHHPCYQSKEEEIADIENDIKLAREELAGEQKDLERIWADFVKWTNNTKPNQEEEIARYEKWVQEKNVSKTAMPTS